jgi:hypothetical protein
MNKKRVTRKARVAISESLYDRDVCGPDALEISESMQNTQGIAAWWEKVKLYAEAMEPLNRAVLLKRNDGVWYLSSVPDRVRVTAEAPTP